MLESYELQLFSRYLSVVSDVGHNSDRASVGTTLRGVVGDPLFVRVGELDQRLRKARQGVAVGSWNIKRSYSKEELERTQLFLLNVPLTHASAEEYGTKYLEFEDCEPDVESLEYEAGTKFRIVRKKMPCALCSKQIDSIRLPFHELKSGEDVYRLWGGEVIVSERFVTLTNTGEFSGGTFFPVSDVTTGDLTSPLEFSGSPAGLEVLSIAAAMNMSPADWNFWLWLNSEAPKPLLEKVIVQQKSTVTKRHESPGFRRNLAQLILRSKPLEISERSRFGATPFDTEAFGYHHCDAGTIAGMRPISALSVIKSSWDGSDLCRTEVYVGGQRQGLFRPYQLLIVSKRFLNALDQNGLKGLQIEVVEVI
jgi:hypothetical protein